jgi:lipoprotein NlpI
LSRISSTCGNRCSPRIAKPARAAAWCAPPARRRFPKLRAKWGCGLDAQPPVATIILQSRIQSRANSNLLAEIPLMNRMLLICGVMVCAVAMGWHAPTVWAAETLTADAEAAYLKGDFEKCIELTNQALQANATDHLALYLRASARVELGQVRRDVKTVRAGIEDARDSLQQIGKLEANYYLPYLYGMTTLAQLENRPEHAATSVKIADSLVTREGIAAEPKANIYYQRAVANTVLEKPGEAAKDYQAAIQLYPQHLGARVGLAESYIQAKAPDKALAAFTEAVQAFPKNPLVYNNRGLFLQQQGRPKEAIADFTKAIEFNPDFAVAYTNRGFTSLNMGKPAAAEPDFNAALKIDPNQPLVYSLRGTCRLSSGNTEAALQDYLTVIKLDPQNVVANADVGFARLFAKDFPGAQQSFEQALAADPNLRYLTPWQLWSGILQGQQDAAAKLSAGSAAKSEDKRDWVDHLMLFLTGQENDKQLLAAAKAKDPNLQNAQTCEAYFFIAEKKSQAGDQNGAAENYRLALQTKAVNLSAYRGAQFALQQFPK